MSRETGFIFDYWPTGSCDMECPFCYGAQVPDFSKLIQDQTGSKRLKMYVPSEGVIWITNSSEARGELNGDQSRGVLTLMRSVGGDAVTFAGGEPLIREDTPELIGFAKMCLDMTVYLSTDGTYVLRRYGQFRDSIDVLGMPLDGSSPERNLVMGRRLYLYKNIRKILEYFRENSPQHLVKLGTVVSRKNIDDIENIGNFLFNTPGLYRPDVWRLYQFEGIGRGRQNAEDYVISNEDFEDVCKEMEMKFPDVDIRPRSNEGNFNAYFFISPDGILQTVDSLNHVSVIDLLGTNTNDLKNLLNGYQDTVRRANQNRSWLQQAPSD